MARPPDRRERPPETTSARYRNDNFRRLTNAEIQWKRERGLCCKCDEKFGPNHRCRNRSLQILLVGEDDEADLTDDNPEKIVAEPEEKLAVEGNVLVLSMHSIVGITSGNTMKVRG